MANEITITLRANDQGSVEIQKFASKGKKSITDFTKKADREMESFTSKMKKTGLKQQLKLPDLSIP